MQQEPGCSLDARERVAGVARLSHTASCGANAARPYAQSTPALVHRIAAERGKGYGYHLHPHLRGLAVLSVGLALFSGRTVGRAVRPPIHRKLVPEADKKAVCRRRPRAALIHSDQDSQYQSDAWQRFCKGKQLGGDARHPIKTRIYRPVLRSATNSETRQLQVSHPREAR